MKPDSVAIGKNEQNAAFKLPHPSSIENVEHLKIAAVSDICRRFDGGGRMWGEVFGKPKPRMLITLSSSAPRNN